MSQCSVTFFPHEKTVAVTRGVTVLEAAARADIVLNNLCGGEGICGRCKMVVLSGEISGGMSDILTREEVKKGTVLSCLAIVESDLQVAVPDDTLAQTKARSDKDAQRFIDDSPLPKDGEFRFSPLVKKSFVEMDPPSLAANSADHQRLTTEVSRVLNTDIIQTRLPLINQLPALLRDADFKVTVTTVQSGFCSEILDVQKGDTSNENFCLTVDIGTTTIVAHLVELNSGKTLDSRACFNAQGVYGREVTSRMISAERKGVSELQRLLVKDLNQLALTLCKQNDIELEHIHAMVCAGNTAISHFLLGMPVENIRRNPYIPASVEPPPIQAADVGIKINPKGILYTLPCISGWVGGDLTAGILATGMFKREELCLLVDIGTNGEVIVGNKEWLMACSASAGPALEGASVECGMRAESGAIEKVEATNGVISYKTINDKKAKGICGSGILDVIAVFLQENIINRSGKFTEKGRDRIVTRDGVKQYILADASIDYAKDDVYITETDIDNIITAKAAIFAAMRIMLQRLDMDFNMIDQFFIAGGFGRYINIDNAIEVGLLPDIPRDKITYVGNTSLQGAKMAACSVDAWRKIIDIGKNTTYYDLMGANDYVEEFSKAMFLPHTDIETFQSLYQKG